MAIFSGRRVPREVILWAVRGYCRYGINYRDLEEMMTERGVRFDRTTIYRWVQKYAPELDKQTRRSPAGCQAPGFVEGDLLVDQAA